MPAPLAPANESTIIIVSGLPRSGTSLMMEMLRVSGFPLLTDNIRQADDSNPNGYYEYEPVKSLKTGAHDWLNEAGGHVVKVVSPLLHFLPQQYTYKVIFMRRKLVEVLASQNTMLAGLRKPATAEEDRLLEKAFRDHLTGVETWLSRQANIHTFYASYNQLLTGPHQMLNELSQFLQQPLDIPAMMTAIDPRLYRNRAQLS